ncbi:MAG: ECF-type sigma factor [Acidobacteriota bacterium]
MCDEVGSEARGEGLSQGDSKKDDGPATLGKTTLDDLFGDVYAQLRRLAHGQRRRGGHLETTSLVHEVYARFVDAERIRVADREHFLALAARAMRQVLLNEARRRGRAKRGGGVADISLLDHHHVAEARLDQLLAIDAALTRLQEHSPRMGQVVECRFFAGMTVEETGRALDLPRRTVERDWTRARAYLAALLEAPEGP